MTFTTRIEKIVMANAVDGIGDHVGKFWVVTEPTVDSVLQDILFLSSVGGMISQAKGGLKQEDIVGLYPLKDKEKAEKHAKFLLEKVKKGIFRN